jgi:hypothetical protein
MKKLLIRALFAGALLSLVLPFEGCATSASSGESKTALVCPQCRMVETVAYLPVGPSFSRAGVGAYGVADPGYPNTGVGAYGVADVGYPNTVHKHTCPGCQGTLTSFVREGKWQHKCSICEQHAFTCSVIHPTE